MTSRIIVLIVSVFLLGSTAMAGWDNNQCPCEQNAKATTKTVTSTVVVHHHRRRPVKPRVLPPAPATPAPVVSPSENDRLAVIEKELEEQQKEQRELIESERAKDAARDNALNVILQTVANGYQLNAQAAKQNAETNAAEVVIHHEDADTRQKAENDQNLIEKDRVKIEGKKVNRDFIVGIVGDITMSPAWRRPDKIMISQTGGGATSSVGDVNASTGAINNTNTSQSSPTITNTANGGAGGAGGAGGQGGQGGKGGNGYGGNAVAKTGPVTVDNTNKAYNQNTNIAAAAADANSSSQSGQGGDKDGGYGHHGDHDKKW